MDDGELTNGQDDAPWSAGGANGGNGAGGNGGGRERSPVPPPRRSSRSRSPGAREDNRDRDRGGRGGRNEEGGGRGINPGNNLHVSALSYKVDTRELEAAFAKIGRVQKAQVMYDPHSRESRGFGFVTMETAEEADAAVAALNGSELMGKAMHVEKARRGRARTPTPGRYYGPPKRGDNERPYDPRPNEGGRRDDRRGGGRDYDRGYGGGGGGPRDYDRGGYGGGRDYDRGYGGGGGGGREGGREGGGGGGRDYGRDRHDDRRY